MGDSFDNYFGVIKIGEKMVVFLIQEYGFLDGLYENIVVMKKFKCKENLINEEKIVWEC